MRFDGESLAYYNNEKVRAAALNSGASSRRLLSFLARRCSLDATEVAARTQCRDPSPGKEY